MVLSLSSRQATGNGLIYSTTELISTPIEFRCRILEFGCWILNFGCRILEFGCRILLVEYIDLRFQWVVATMILCKPGLHTLKFWGRYDFDYFKTEIRLQAHWHWFDSTIFWRMERMLQNNQYLWYLSRT